MYWRTLIGSLIIPAFALCAALSLPLDTPDLLQGSVISPDLPYPQNLSAATGNTSSGNILKLRCDPVRYGRNLKVESCMKVFNYIEVDDEEFIFAERGSVQLHHLNLPYRVTSSMYIWMPSLLHMGVSGPNERADIHLLNMVNR